MSKETFKLDNNNPMDLYEFENSDFYADLALDTISMSKGVGPLLKGYNVIVTGNVEGIHLSTFDELYIEVVYSIHSDMLSKDYRKLFLAKGDIASKIRQEVKVGTGISLIAQYTGAAVTFGHHNGLEVIKLNEINTDLRFPYYYCPDCNVLHGIRVYNEYPSKDDCYCPICATDLKVIYNLYKEFDNNHKFKELL